MQEPDDRYQLVHDYLVEPIRQKFNADFRKQLEEAKAARERAEVARIRLLKRSLAGAVVAVVVLVGSLGLTERQRRRAVKSEEQAQESERQAKASERKTQIALESEAEQAAKAEKQAQLASAAEEEAQEQAELAQQSAAEAQARQKEAEEAQAAEAEQRERAERQRQAAQRAKEAEEKQRREAESATQREAKQRRLAERREREAQEAKEEEERQRLIAREQEQEAIAARNRAEKGETNARIAALSLSTRNLMASNLWLEALIKGLEAGQQVKEDSGKLVEGDTRMQAVAALREVVYSIKERNRLGHGSVVTSVAFSPDGETIASASHDGTVRLWNRQGEALATFEGHGSSVTSVAFSPDGETIASASTDGTVRLWNLDLENLFARGCPLLHDYLMTHPQVLEKVLDSLQTCQFQTLQPAAASTLVTQGERLVRAGNFEQAVARFRKAQNWNSNLNFDPQQKAAPAFVRQGSDLGRQGKIAEAVAKFEQALALDPSLDLNWDTSAIDNNPEAVAKYFAARGKVGEGVRLARDGEIAQAISTFQQAQQLDPNLEISARSWSALCWNGSLHGHAAKVMFACEKAVALEPEDGGIRDSRGLARALTGDTEGAIEDFQAFVDWNNNDEQKGQRQGWIDALRAGQNPFTPEEIEKLRN